MGNYIGKIAEVSGVTAPHILTREEQLLRIYTEKTQNDFEYALNVYVRDYNNDAARNGTKTTTFFKALEAVVKKCGDLYNYNDILKDRR